MGFDSRRWSVPFSVSSLTNPRERNRGMNNPRRMTKAIFPTAMTNVLWPSSPMYSCSSGSSSTRSSDRISVTTPLSANHCTSQRIPLPLSSSPSPSSMARQSPSSSNPWLPPSLTSDGQSTLLSSQPSPRRERPLKQSIPSSLMYISGGSGSTYTSSVQYPQERYIPSGTMTSPSPLHFPET